MKNMANKIINVLIVDDEQIVREGLRYIIDWNTLGFCICGEAANGEDALEMIASTARDWFFSISGCPECLARN